ncbi:hypothetical protein ACFOEK_20040 [Litoribrevibacter euphylliae]|uniref:Lipoprotein n=1 Tax=Litoribrevibacter euphylliae TaxID=1834034 RepID=A0ABV7HPW1_9GAMM
MKYLVVSLALLILSGCSNIYTKPHEGVENAKLRLASIPSNNNFVHEPKAKSCIYGNGDAQITILGSKANLFRSLDRNGVPLYNSEISDSHQNEVYVPAGTEFSFQFNSVGFAGFSPGVYDPKYGAMYAWCRKIVTFTPEPNGNYEALFDFVELPSGKETCDVTLFEITKNNQGDYVKSESQDYNVVDRYCGS